jgi:hypothetical protein
MRVTVLFWAFYVTLISCLSCVDGVTAYQNDKDCTLAAVTQTNGGANGLSDWCSPLCQCHSCGGAITPLLDAVQIEAPRPANWVTSRRYGHLVVAAPASASGSCWQPPQL